MKDIKNKSKEELEKIIADKRESLRQFRFALSGGKPDKNIRKARADRKDIARAMTTINASNGGDLSNITTTSK